jgi:flagellar basal-body rod modification protein FlgD
MFSTKIGTQAWSSKPQVGNQHGDDTHYASAQTEEKLNQDIGNTLNKIADPNYVDTSHKVRAVGNPELGKDAFMNLLITQMKNQDPTNPLKSHEMAAQLATFTQLEKLTNIDSGIEKLRTDAKPDKNFEALQLIGKTVSTDSSHFTRVDQKSAHDLRFRLAADAINTTVNIKDGKGATVRTLTYNNLKSGKNNLSWNGQLEDGTPAPVGDYAIEVQATASNGNKIFSEFKTEGQITGVNFTARGPQVMVGRDAIDLADVKNITDSSKLGQQAPPPQMIPQGIPGMPQGIPGLPPGMLPPGMSLTPPGEGGGEAATPLPPGMMPIGRGLEHSASREVHVKPQAKTDFAKAAPKQAAHKTTVMPEAHAYSAKRANLENGSLDDASMTRQMQNKLSKETRPDEPKEKKS